MLAKHHFRYLLVRFLHVGSVGSLSTVVGLDGERVLFLKLTVQLVLGPDHSFACGLVQHHCLERNILAVNTEAANLPWTRGEKGETIAQFRPPLRKKNLKLLYSIYIFFKKKKEMNKPMAKTNSTPH